MAISFEETFGGAFRDVGGAVHNVRHPSYAARGDATTATGGAMTSTSAVLTRSGGTAFAASDVGKVIVVPGAGVAGAILVTTILSYASPTSVTLATAASTTVSGKTVEFGTDDTTAFEDAWDAVKMTNGTVLVPAGAYMTPGLSLTGATGKTKIIGEGAKLVGTQTNSAILALSNSSGFSIEGMEIYHAGYTTRTTSGHGVKLDTCSFFSLRNIHLHDVGSIGAVLFSCTEGRITDFIIRNNGADGVHLTRQSKRISVSGVRGYQIGDDTVAVVGYKQQGAVPGVGDDGGPCEDITITGCTIFQSQARGITVAGGKRVTITGNVVESTKGAGIYVQQESNASWITYGNEDVTVVGNVVNGAATYDSSAINNGGIQVGSQSTTYPTINIVVAHNIIRGSRWKSLAIGTNSPTGTTRDVILQGNQLIGNLSSSGIECLYVTNLQIQGNFIQDAYGYGIYVDAGCDGVCHVIGNVVDDANLGLTAAVDAIQVQADAAVVCFNTVKDSGGTIAPAPYAPRHVEYAVDTFLSDGAIVFGNLVGTLPARQKTEGVATPYFGATKVFGSSPLTLGDVDGNEILRFRADSPGAEDMVMELNVSGAWTPMLAFDNAGTSLLYSALNLRGLDLYGLPVSSGSYPSLGTEGIGFRSDTVEGVARVGASHYKFDLLPTSAPQRRLTPVTAKPGAGTNVTLGEFFFHTNPSAYAECAWVAMATGDAGTSGYIRPIAWATVVGTSGSVSTTITAGADPVVLGTVVFAGAADGDTVSVAAIGATQGATIWGDIAPAGGSVTIYGFKGGTTNAVLSGVTFRISIQRRA